MNTLPHSSAAERNRQPILEQLQALLPASGTVLEIGSGTGQHAVFFSRHLPALLWQPSETRANLKALTVSIEAQGGQRMLPALCLDVLHDPWPGQAYGAAYSANTAHIMPWEAVVAMFAGVAGHLLAGARFCLYGPFNIDDSFTSPGNAQFDAQLRAENPCMGIRDLEAMTALAMQHQLQLEQKIAMPANNFILVFRGRSHPPQASTP